MNKKSGFTLIEVLTVVIILGILTAAALPQYRKVIRRAEAANALTNVKTIFDSAKRYKMSHSAWPKTLNQLDVELADVDEHGNMGEFQYTLLGEDSGIVSACRLSNRSAANTYCLQAHYRLGTTRDVYTCSYSNLRFKDICETLGTCENSVCIIKTRARK